MNIASRLSFFLHGSIPDDRLLELASAKQLQNPEMVKAEARRLLQSPEARPVVQLFFQQWLDHGVATKIKPDMVTHMETVLSAEELSYFDYILSSGTIQEQIELDEFWEPSNQMFSAFQAEFNRYVDDIVFGQGSLEALLTDKRGYVSDRTARIYGVSIGDGPSYDYETKNYFSDLSLHQIELLDAQRSGILTQGLFLAGHSHPIQPAPVLRGVFIRERLLCIPPASPPDDIPAIGETGSGEWTTNRERYAQHTSDPNCASCHQTIDALGFPLKTMTLLELGGTLTMTPPSMRQAHLLGTDFDGDIQDGLELIKRLSTSQMVHDCLVTNLYRYGMHRTETDLDSEAIRQLQTQFWQGGGLIPNLLVHFVSSDSFLMRREPTGVTNETPQFLNAMGLGTGSLFLPSLAHANDAPPKRLLLLYSAQGCAPQRWLCNPYGLADTIQWKRDWTSWGIRDFSDSLMPLFPFAQHCAAIGGLGLVSCAADGNGFHHERMKAHGPSGANALWLDGLPYTGGEPSIKRLPVTYAAQINVEALNARLVVVLNMKTNAPPCTKHPASPWSRLMILESCGNAFLAICLMGAMAH